MSMDEREFIEVLYQGWSKTTDAEHAYWQPVEMPNNPGQFKVYAVTVDAETQEESRKLVATYLSEEDASFITAIHGSFGDVCRRVLEAYDEADKLDYERDTLMCRIAELEVEKDALADGILQPRGFLDLAVSNRDGAGVE